MGLRYHLAYLSSNNYNFTVSAALSRDICCIIRSRENADEEFLTERCGAEGAVTPLIVNNNKYLGRRSPSSLSQSYQCVNNTGRRVPYVGGVPRLEHLSFRDCQHSNDSCPRLPEDAPYRLRHEGPQYKESPTQQTT